MIKIGLCGATGKMGRMIADLSSTFSDKCQIISEFSSQNTVDDLEIMCGKVDVIIDFSSITLLKALLLSSIKTNVKLVIGTTGLSVEQFKMIEDAAQTKAILYSANMSLGANLVAMLAKEACDSLDNKYDIDIIDLHHRHKRDKPSGTSLMYGKLLAESRGFSTYLPNSNEIVRGKNSIGYARNSIGYASVRAGETIGEHIISFTGSDDVITIKHEAKNRKIYASGAIESAIWIHEQKCGLYSMSDMLASHDYLNK